MMEINLVWFRQDLRLSDNPALRAGLNAGVVIPVFIHNPTDTTMGSASKCWLHDSLASLDTQLNGQLKIFLGDELEVLLRLVKENNIKNIFWNRRYSHSKISLDKKIKARLNQEGVNIESHNGSLLWEPWENLKSDQTPYRVFTPFYKKALQQLPPPRKPQEKPANMMSKIQGGIDSDGLEALQLKPNMKWVDEVFSNWEVGEAAAQRKLEQFVQEKLAGYQQARDVPALSQTSYLSPHLHFGEISPQQVFHRVNASVVSPRVKDDKSHFLRELCWREFSYYLLYHFPGLLTENFNRKFDDYPWKDNAIQLDAWQKGLTGIPIIDAGMRELWQTGYMHNRVRMLVASFLVKNLQIHWRHGQAWFNDCLVDADEANNSASWQWVAGSGADAAPYFRIFNPVTQSLKFDAEGQYIRRYVPEISALNSKHIHQPWAASKETLLEANIELGKDYPMPLVDLSITRKMALEAYNKMKSLK